MERAFGRTDVVGLIAAAGVLGSVGLVLADPGERQAMLAESLSNLRAIGAATASYRLDNHGAVPMDVIRGSRQESRSPILGWAAWLPGGKNISSDSTTWVNGTFDIEAADRPLNPYVYPDFQFSAPPRPQRLPRFDPARAQQAKAFKDPADRVGHQQFWPSANRQPVISCYEDVGTSYLFNMTWWEQIQRNYPNLNFRDQFAEGMRRMAADQGVDPSRFVQFSDEFQSIVTSDLNPAYAGNHGATNGSASLFADGHAGLTTFYGRASERSLVNETYSLIFEDLGRPSGGRGRRGGEHQAAPAISAETAIPR